MRGKLIARLRDYYAKRKVAEQLYWDADHIDARDIHGLAEKWRLYQQAEALRDKLAPVEAALARLNSVERQIVERLDMAPHKNNCAQLCDTWDREPATVYRWREQALQKLERWLVDDSVSKK